jgi:RHS repeat-associated protein
VEYVHGAELDAPLAMLRAEYSDSIGGGIYIPLANWKGSYDGGYSIEHCYTREWTTMLAPPVGSQGPDSTNNHATSGTETLCPTVEWPAQHEWAARQYRRGFGGPHNWMGSLIYGQRDFSGLHYRRNRFYDAEQGRFTQEDPIGPGRWHQPLRLCGGDPVTYSDPYGLMADTLRYNGSTLTLYADDGSVKWSGRATSGRGGTTAADQDERNRGPLPEGNYTIDPSQISTVRSFGHYLARNALGDWRFNRVGIQPAAGTNTFGRSGFMLHGGDTPGSAGCIDVGIGELRLFPLLAQLKGRVPLIVDYPSANTVTTPEGPYFWIK